MGFCFSPGNNAEMIEIKTSLFFSALRSIKQLIGTARVNKNSAIKMEQAEIPTGLSLLCFRFFVLFLLELFAALCQHIFQFCNGRFVHSRFFYKGRSQMNIAFPLCFVRPCTLKHIEKEIPPRFLAT